MKLNESQLARLKEVELNILKAVIQACDALQIKYYLLGGTLLGAVRHQGFIPWDDDIDIGMLRRDYEIFKEKAQELLPSDYFLQTKETDPEYPHNFMKVRDSRTTFIETGLKKFSINHGVYLDIFPLDYYPDAKLERTIFDIKQQIMKLRLRDEVCIPAESRHEKKEEVLLSIGGKLSRVFYPSMKYMQDSKERLYTKTKSASYIGNFSGAWGKREIVPAEWYGDGYMLRFEGLYVRAPSAYEKWLTQVYGDYMKLPPKEKQVAHHYNEVVDLDHPYTEYSI